MSAMMQHVSINVALHTLVVLGLWTTLKAQPVKSSDLTGTIVTIQADDFEHRRPPAPQQYFQDSATGRHFRLHAIDGTPGQSFPTDTTVHLRGTIDRDELTLQSEPAKPAVMEPVRQVLTGKHRLLVIAINFQDDTLGCSPDAIAEMLFGETNSVNSLYMEMSAGALGFNGDVVGPFTINFSNTATDCAYFRWADAADAAATAAGISLGDYQHRVYVLPHHYPCRWSGLATIGGNPGRVWVMDCAEADIYAHELGHNLGLQHAASDANNDGILPDDYGDASDIMGRSGHGLRQLNAPHKEQIGWLSPDKIVTARQPMVIQLAPLETPAADTPHAQALKTPKSGSASEYYFSYRRPLGFDANLITKYQNALSVHHSMTGLVRTYLVSALADNTPFIDTSTGLTVTMLEHNDNAATVQVAYECYPATPVIVVDSTPWTVTPGATTSWTIGLSNHDSPTCASTLFQLQAVVPAGWKATVAPTSLLLAPGQTGTATVVLTVPIKPRHTNPPIRLTVSDNSNPSHSATRTQSVLMLRADVVPDTVAPMIPANFQSRSNKRNVRLRWDRSTDNVGVSGYTIWRDGFLLSRTKHLQFRDRTAVAGTSYWYSVSAFDGSDNSSIPGAEVNVTAP